MTIFAAGSTPGAAAGQADVDTADDARQPPRLAALAQPLGKVAWDNLLKKIKAGACTPFIGAGAAAGLLPRGSKLATYLADLSSYPLRHDREDLSSVSQALVVLSGGDSTYPKSEVCDLFRKLLDPQTDATERATLHRELSIAATGKPGDPSPIHHLLAALDLPVYLTTNYDDLMCEALRQAGKTPTREYCRWKDDLGPIDLKRRSLYAPTKDKPLVFHLHGHMDVPESLVLTEDDYVDFLMRLGKQPNLLPARVEEAMSDASLLFVGYGMDDLNFRVLFRSLATLREVSSSRSHITVQSVHSDYTEETLNYLKSYFQLSRISVFWGGIAEFVESLRERLARL